MAGAFVWAEHTIDSGAATTRSDLQGRYFLCNLAPNTYFSVAKPGFERTLGRLLGPFGPVGGPQSAVLDVEFKRE